MSVGFDEGATIMEFTDYFGFVECDDVYSLDVIHSVACLHSSIDRAMQNPLTTQDELERIRDQAEEVVETASRLLSHFVPFGPEFESINVLKSKVFDLVIVPLNGILSSQKGGKSPTELWRSVEGAFYGEESITQDIRALERILRDVL